MSDEAPSNSQEALAAWTEVLGRLSVPPASPMDPDADTAKKSVDLHRELAKLGAVSEEQLYRAVAGLYGVGFLDRIDSSRLMISDTESTMLLGNPSGLQIVRIQEPDSAPAFLIAPRRLNPRGMRRLLSRRRSLRKRLRFAAPKTLRAAIADRAASHLVRRASSQLFDDYPSYSARTVANAWQGGFFSFLAILFAVCLLAAPTTTGLVFHIVFSMFFLSCVGLRVLAAASAGPPVLAPVGRPSEKQPPVYSVLVALYREADLISDLLIALGRIEWPRDRLEIKLVCEADDAETLAAIDAHPLRPCVEVIRVPPVGPRTKPKALNFALPFTSGEFVVLFDAEDRPHPLQLIEAWQMFEASDESLACLQAPLVIANWRENLISRSFALEYAALFRGILPWLSARGLVLPLGGTSNHFRRAALEDVGAWDPYNVTEDADLGLRLARFGYRCGTITHPTHEDACIDWPTWVPQRTRWLKGWMATFLVHMRHPVRMARDLGTGSFLATQVLFAGMIASTLAHPVFLLSGAWLIVAFAMGAPTTTFHSALLIIDSINISLGYLAFLTLGRRTLLDQEKRGFWKAVMFTPVYWVMMSLAAWRALFQLMTAPHRWEKTTHRRRHASRDVFASGGEPPAI